MGRFIPSLSFALFDVIRYRVDPTSSEETGTIGPIRCMTSAQGPKYVT